MKIDIYKIFFCKTLSSKICLSDHQKGMQENKGITIEGQHLGIRQTANPG